MPAHNPSIAWKDQSGDEETNDSTTVKMLNSTTEKMRDSTPVKKVNSTPVKQVDSTGEKKTNSTEEKKMKWSYRGYMVPDTREEPMAGTSRPTEMEEKT